MHRRFNSNRSSPTPASEVLFAAFDPRKHTGASIEDNAPENNARWALPRRMPAVERANADAEFRGELLRCDVRAREQICVQ